MYVSFYSSLSLNVTGLVLNFAICHSTIFWQTCNIFTVRVVVVAITNEITRNNFGELAFGVYGWLLVCTVACWEVYKYFVGCLPACALGCICVCVCACVVL